MLVVFFDLLLLLLWCLLRWLKGGFICVYAFVMLVKKPVVEEALRLWLAGWRVPAFLATLSVRLLQLQLVNAQRRRRLVLGGRGSLFLPGRNPYCGAHVRTSSLSTMVVFALDRRACTLRRALHPEYRM